MTNPNFDNLNLIGDAIYIDARSGGYGVSHGGKSEVWEVDLETALAKLQPLVAGMDTEDRERIVSPMPIGFPRRQVKIERFRGSSFGVTMGYTLEEGCSSFGGTSAIWPSSADEVIVWVRRLLEALRAIEGSAEIIVNIGGMDLRW